MIIKYLKYVTSMIKCFFKRGITIKGMCFFEKLHVVVDKQSQLGFGKKDSARMNLSIYCNTGGKIKIGDNCFFNQNCILACKYDISISNNCIFGPNVCIYDHDHDYRNFTSMRDTFTCLGISIGEGTWIGANVTILKGAIIGNRCVVAAGTVVTAGNYPDDSLIYNDRTLKTKTIER